MDLHLCITTVRQICRSSAIQECCPVGIITFVVTETRFGLCLRSSLTTSGLLDLAAKWIGFCPKSSVESKLAPSSSRRLQTDNCPEAEARCKGVCFFWKDMRKKVVKWTQNQILSNRWCCFMYSNYENILGVLLHLYMIYVSRSVLSIHNIWSSLISIVFVDFFS